MRYSIALLTLSLAACSPVKATPVADLNDNSTVFGLHDVGAGNHYTLFMDEVYYIEGDISPASLNKMQFCSEDRTCMTKPFVLSQTDDLPQEMIYSTEFRSFHKRRHPTGFTETVGYYDGICTVAVYNSESEMVGVNTCQIDENGFIEYLHTYIVVR